MVALAPFGRRAGLLLAVASIAALLTGFRVSLAPLALHPRTFQVGAAEAKVLVDTASSELTDDARTTKYNAELAGRLARSDIVFLQSNGSTEALGHAVGLKNESVSASGPFTLLLNRGNLEAKFPTAPDPRRVNHAYRLLLDVGGRNPTLTIYGQAPTARSAIELVDAARMLLLGFVSAHETSHPTPASYAAVLRPLGPTVGGLVGGSARWQLMVFVFVVVLTLGVSLLSAWRWRRYRALADRMATDALDRLDDRPEHADDWPNTTRLLPWALAGFMAMLFLVPFDAIKLPAHLPLDSTLDRPVLVALGLLWVSTLAVLSGAARPRLKLTRIHAAVLLFFAVCCLSLGLNGNTLASMNETTLVMKKLALLVSFIVFFFIVASALRPREVPRFAALMVALGVIVAVGAVIEYRFRYDPFYELWGKLLPVQPPAGLDARDSIGRLTVFGPTIQPLELAALLGMVLPFAVMGSIDARTRRRRVLYTIAVGLLFAGALATARKTALIAPIGALLLLVAYRPRDVGHALVRLVLVLAVFVHIAAPGALGHLFSQLEPGKFASALTTTDRTARYDAVRPDIVNHLLLGRGYQSYDPHKYRILDNEYLDLLITAGVLGLLAYSAIFGAAVSEARPTIRGPDPRRSSLALAALASMGVIAIASILFDVLSFPHVPYLLFFIAGMIVVLRAPSPASALARVSRPVVSPLPGGYRTWRAEPLPHAAELLSPADSAHEPVLTT